MASAGNIQMDVTPRARTEATPAALEEAFVAPTLIPKKLPPKVTRSFYDQLPTQPY